MGYLNYLLSPAQARAKTRLDVRISDALAQGLEVPCVGQYEKFDQADQDAAQECLGCPVLAVCRIYAETGAVRHGIIGGRLAGAVTEQTAA